MAKYLIGLILIFSTNLFAAEINSTQLCDEVTSSSDSFGLCEALSKHQNVTNEKISACGETATLASSFQRCLLLSLAKELTAQEILSCGEATTMSHTYIDCLLENI